MAKRNQIDSGENATETQSEETAPTSELVAASQQTETQVTGAGTTPPPADSLYKIETDVEIPEGDASRGPSNTGLAAAVRGLQPGGSIKIPRKLKKGKDGKETLARDGSKMHQAKKVAEAAGFPLKVFRVAADGEGFDRIGRPAAKAPEAASEANA